MVSYERGIVMGFKQVGGALAASVFTISAVVVPAFQAETMVEAATKVKLNIQECNLEVGKATKLKLKGAKAVKFESSDSKIATVSKSGKIKAKKAGTATITVYDENGKIYKCKVTVVKKGKTGERDYSNIDLGGMEIIIRDWWHPTLDGDYTIEPSNDYEEAVEKYRQDMMKKYNFTIREARISDWGTANTDFADYVSGGGDKNNYVFCLHIDESVADSMQKGYMYDLATLDCLDFNEDKFTRNKIHEKFSSGSSIYAFYPGYTEPRDGVFFNKQILRNAGIDPDSIYEAQKNGTWTWDMFERIMEKCQKDIDGDGKDDIYGLTCNEINMTSIAVLSNNGAYVGKDKKGAYTYELESAETVKALKWCVEMYSKYDNHDPQNASWDYYKEEWLKGKAAFLVDQEYVATPGNTFEYTDFDTGFVMFPKGPDAKDYSTVFSDNLYAIPSCYDPEKAWKIAFAWNLYTDPVSGYEDFNPSINNAYLGNFDQRTLTETLPMMSDPKRGKVTYHELINGINIGPMLTWQIGPDIDVDDVIEASRKELKDAIKKANKT